MFTGLRVGLATMTAFRLALGIPLVGVSTLEGLAWNLPNADLPIVSTVSIRGDLVYWGIFQWQQGGLVCRKTDQIGKLSEICGSLSEPTIILGEGWIRNKESLQSDSTSIVEGPSDAIWPSAKGIGRAGRALLEKGQWLPEGCSPRYIQPSYAEIPKSSVQTQNLCR
jgi:tRNA threonylcarbamoyladenosine biosynthesis protein TsaB